MLDVFRAAEVAVRHAYRAGWSEADARQLVRGEISFDMFNEIRADLRGHTWLVDCGDPSEFLQGKAPLKHRGVSFYVVPYLPAPWRIIGLGQLTSGRPCATVVEGKVNAEVG